MGVAHPVASSSRPARLPLSRTRPCEQFTSVGRFECFAATVATTVAATVAATIVPCIHTVSCCLLLFRGDVTPVMRIREFLMGTFSESLGNYSNAERMYNCYRTQS